MNHSTLDQHLINVLKVISKFISVFVTLVGFVVLIGWYFDIQVLKSILPESVSMKPNTAIGFVISGLALNFLHSTQKLKRRISQGLALAIALLGLLTMSQYFLGWDLGIDQLLFTDKSAAITTSNPGRMSPISALNFSLMGSALWLCADRSIRYRQVQIIALITALTSLQVLIGYIYGIKPLFGLSLLTHTAIHTGITFLLLSVGTLLVAPSEGLMGLIISNSAGGITARVLLPAAIIIPFTLGGLRVFGEKVGLFDNAFGLSLHVIGNVTAFTGLIWYCAKGLYRLDIKRQRAEEALRTAYAELEVRVEKRTGELSQANQVLEQEIAERLRTEAALQQSLRQMADMKFALDQSSIMAITDARGIITEVNDKFCELSGYSTEELIGQNHRIINSGYHSKTFFEQMWATISQGQVWQGEIKNHAKDGTYYWVATTIVPFLDDTGKPYQYIAIRFDITNLKETQEALRQSEERFRRAILDAPMPIMLHTEDGEILQLNHAWIEITGYSIEDIPTIADWTKRAYGSRQEQVQSQINSLYRLNSRIAEGEYTIATSTGETRIWDFYSAPLGHLTDGRSLVISTGFDVTERKQAESQLRRNAFYDGLTGLANRALFMEHLKHALQQTKRQKDYLFAVLFLDLDRFKVINDSLGHLKGDQFLITIAHILTACIRSTDIAARLGGDEFAIQLEGIQDVSDAIKVAERIQQELRSPLKLDEQEVFTSASIGIALSSTIDYDQPEQLLRDADTAMYQAKALGKSRYVLFNPDMYANALARLQLEADLRRAIERLEFQVYYQPIVSLTNGSILGFEALLRWQHPERGLLNPGDFIPLAEETGLIVEIGYWVLYEACRQMRAWQMSYPHHSLKKMSVNLSVKQFCQPNLIEQIRHILDSTGLDANSLALEITESVIVENGDEATAILLQLRELGIEISLDDFGTGYSSLGRLYSFPISVLKIDRSFVNPMTTDNRNLEIIDIIVALAHKLGMTVIAEGVETQEQVPILKNLHCESAQGYFFSSPLHSSGAVALIATNPEWCW
ncbi:bifunctional diguanylate cyclase/phosphodiesterase [Nostoc sp. FACHB-888]|uniref:bifunctional diguanylate cyclase/phosphodiesterase n=1 Tax=Nostoc sp. FACHB-888 TaxID=2692842 RepID=UPI001688EAD0|nr:bifunctional diguanylate cyclase/phosphodiesterase [Nostoc sp. FACHB-888]MBD2242221.1 EAL domain-containing protein [Nostoc sp. FACHB-888]